MQSLYSRIRQKICSESKETLSRRILFLTGEPGIGKSVFLLSIVNLLVEEEKAVVLYMPEGICLPMA